MKDLMKKGMKKTAHGSVSVTVGGGSKMCQLACGVFLDLSLRAGSMHERLEKKKESMHAWIDETIAIGNEELKKNEQQ